MMPKMSGWLADAGFEGVEEVEKVIPTGRWAKDEKLKEIGNYYMVHLLDGGRDVVQIHVTAKLTSGRHGKLHDGAFHPQRLATN